MKVFGIKRKPKSSVEIRMSGGMKLVVIREMEESDLEQVIDLICEIDATSEYMLYEAGERCFQPETIEKIWTSNTDTMFIAEENKRLLGYLMAIGGKARRNRHSAYLIIGIRKTERGKGIGTKLFQALEKWAKTKKMHRLELTVAVRNKAGLALYEKMGFEIEGIKRDALLVNGEWVDEYYMAKLLPMQETGG